jgi:putative redox protein
VAEWLEVTARSLGGYESRVTARSHEIAVDEPEYAGGRDAGMMPTEMFCASIASCFCLALQHVAGKRGRELPGLTVRVRAERAGREPRYGRILVEVDADVPGEELEALIEPARRVCWVSNTLVEGTELSYRCTSVEGRTRE